MAKAALFYLRFCRRCQREEIEVRPFMGARQYVPLRPWPVGTFPDVSAHELGMFATATVENCKNLGGGYFTNDPR